MLWNHFLATEINTYQTDMNKNLPFNNYSHVDFEFTLNGLSYERDLNVSASDFDAEYQKSEAVFCTRRCLSEWTDVKEW